ncbi:MAG: acyl-CoA thioesterase [Devosiaceae bacterium]|nr:acyl-CoA thioesterase [Devosiaceae bacterium MH13]
MVFEMPQKVMFKHCDPAGIVFYPRYFEMMNDCVEAFFDVVLGTPFERLHGSGRAVPTAQIETRFLAPSRHGDPLVLQLVVTAVGNSSMQFAMTALCDDEKRFETRSTLVHTNERGRPSRWPDELRTKLQSCLGDAS